MWKDKDKSFLEENRNKLTPKQIAEALGKTERAVRLFMYRQGIPVKRMVKCPLIVKLLTIKFGAPKYFSPDRQWFETVGIGQKRFSDLKNGYAQPTDEELRKIAKGINLSVDESLTFYQSRQLELFN